MAFINIKPELKQDMSRLSDILNIPEPLLVSANLNADVGEFYFPGLHPQAGKDAAAAETYEQLQLLVNGEPGLENEPWLTDTVIYDSQTLKHEIEKIAECFPFVTYHSIGRSVLGQPIYELNIGAEHAEKRTHINASFHANEWITTSVLMKWIKEYCLSLCKGGEILGFSPLRLFQMTKLSIVPLVNPDGVDLVLNGPEHLGINLEPLDEMNEYQSEFREWKANINGVDLNNQFPSFWEIEKQRKPPKAPSYRDYPGDAPLTEPEAIVMHDLIESRPPDRLIALHTQGEEIYWGYEGFEPPESVNVVQVFERLSGYKGIRYIDSYAGFRDWFIHFYGKEGYTVELGKGKNPLPIADFDDIYCKSRGILWASCFFES
ncbi:M14 family metallocarboxypeptidase [Bacillus glycinifermentans]|uniref:M14 family metallopeptidase n=1 Tax=Bacillus glycinifermentans TaxID=1664069 RepID=UPI003D193F29